MRSRGHLSQFKAKTSAPFLISAVSSVRGTLIGIGMTSCFINILALTGSFFMLQVYDRVIPARSLPTLVGLGIITLTLFAFLGLLELLRSLVLARLGQRAVYSWKVHVPQTFLLERCTLVSSTASTW